MTPAVHLLVFEGFADCVPAYAVAELRGRYPEPSAPLA